MASFGTAAGIRAPGVSSTAVEVTPPTSATIMIGALSVEYFSTPTASLAWDGNAMTIPAGSNRDNGVETLVALGWYASPGASAANVTGGGGSGSDTPSLIGVGIAGSETTDPVRDTTEGQVTGGTDISWTPTGLATGDAMIVIAAAFNIAIAAGSGTTEAYYSNQTGNFTNSVGVYVKIAASGADTIDVACNGTTEYAGICIKNAAGGGGTQEDITAEVIFGSTLSGIASVNFPANAELTSSTFNVSGQAASQGSGQEDIEATLEADFDVIDGDSLNIYVAGFSTLSSGFQVEGTTANEDVEHIDGTLTWSSQVNDLRVETLLENSGELSAGFQLENSSTILQLNASLNFQASLTGSTGLGKNPNEVIRTGTDFIDTGIDYVKNFDNQIVKTY